MSLPNDPQKELELWQRRLQKRREQKATFGISADPSIDIEIEDIEARVRQLQADRLAQERTPAQSPAPRSQSASLPTIEVAPPGPELASLRVKPRIFLCHASEDKPRVKELYHTLKDAGYWPWLDKFDLLPGQRWRPVIKKVVTDPNNLILVCLSQHAITKQGVVQQEIKWALDILEQIPEEAIYLIPVRLEVCRAPEQLAEFHWVDIFEPDGFEYLIRALDFELRQRAKTPPPPQAKPTPAQKPQILRAEDILPAPFAWVEIPAGQVKIDQKVYPVEPFAIAKYPLTNAQFKPFIEAGGYKEKKWWTEAGWEVCQKEKWTEPRYWTDKKWNGKDQPVVGVSWYEAVAYCVWLSERSGQQIMLPTEEQWQYAAQGDDGREYPWGNQWACRRCNNSVKPCNSSGTTPVTAYEGKDKGDSPFGVVDMAGNVWEWCLTDYENKTNDIHSQAKYRVLRGGSWDYSYSANFRVSPQSWNFPLNRDGDYSVGIRLARSSKPSAPKKTVSQSSQPKPKTAEKSISPTPQKSASPPQQRPAIVKKRQILRAETLLPAPFAWIKIPAGQVTIKDKVYPVAPFAIAKYPLTNAQFAPFIEAGGYKEKKWWTEAGWEAREQGWDWNSKESKWKPTGQPWTEPRYWTDKKWTGKDQPVVGVSWYEAVAYCVWLSEQSGQKIMLPAEAQWQYAAQGDDGREYPWGKEWDCQRCNNSVKPCDSKGTTLVTAYEGKAKGDSPFGVVDMAGNVWEWCLTEYESGSNERSGTNVRVLRGGSWFNYDPASFRVSYRGRYDPGLRHGDVGIRLALSL